jgi:transposase
VFTFIPLRRDRRKRVEQLRRWDGQPLPPRLKAQLLRELDRLELIISQIATLEAERDRILQANPAQTEMLWGRRRGDGTIVAVKPDDGVPHASAER